VEEHIKETSLEPFQNLSKYEQISHTQAREIKCFKCLGKGHLASQCPNERTMILWNKDEYSSQEEETSESEENEKKEKKEKIKRNSLGTKLRHGRRVFFPTRSFRKKKNLKIKLKRYFYLNNLQASFFVKEHLHALPNLLKFLNYLLKSKEF